MTQLIPSEFVRNFYKKHEIEFSDRERAAILQNNENMPLEDKLSEFRELADMTEDSDLKSELGSILSRYAERLELLKNNEEKRCIYFVEREYCFFGYEKALERAKLSRGGSDSSCRIEKYLIGDNPSEKNHFQISADINGDGKMLQISGENFHSEITSGFVPFENPFERGDIVMDCNSREIGVVETSQKHWAELIEKSRENPDKFTFADSALSVEFVRCGGFRKREICPIYLEKIESFDRDDNSSKLLRVAADLLRGSGSLHGMFGLYEKALKSENIIHEIHAEKSVRDLKLDAIPLDEFIKFRNRVEGELERRIRNGEY